MRAIATRSILLACLLSPAVVAAQDKSPTPASAPVNTAAPGHYKLVYRLLQLGEDNKAVKTRSYSTIVASDDPDSSPAQIRNGDKLPLSTGGSNFTQYTYQDVGTNIDTLRPTIHGKDLALQVSADLTTVVKGDGDDAKRPPVIRHISWRANVLVPLGKPTVIFTSDNVSDDGKTELELTALPVREP